MLPQPPWMIMRGLVWGGFEEDDMVSLGFLDGVVGSLVDWGFDVGFIDYWSVCLLWCLSRGLF